jgi:GNAT superfamily N-acetyltransferase
MASAIAIRPAHTDDLPAMLEMLQASGAEQGHPEQLAVDLESLRADGFGASPRFQTLIAEHDGVRAGIAVYYFNYSTWIHRDGLYLEDLFVRRDHRRVGVASALMTRLKAIAAERGCGRFQWLVLHDNTPAIRFCESLGATMLPEWRVMMIDPRTT